MASLRDIRATFLDYFASHQHEVVQSAPLVPQDDPGTAAPLLDGNRPGNDNNALDTMGVTEVLSQI